MKNNISKYTTVQANCRNNHFIEALNKITDKKDMKRTLEYCQQR